MGKRKIELKIDYLTRPIFLSDGNTGELYTGIDVIDNNEKIRKLNFEIGYMYDCYYEFNSHDQDCWFNEEQFEKDRLLLLSMIKELIDELNRVNDGSYEIIDETTEYIQTL